MHMYAYMCNMSYMYVNYDNSLLLTYFHIFALSLSTKYNLSDYNKT